MRSPLTGCITKKAAGEEFAKDYCSFSCSSLLQRLRELAQCIRAWMVSGFIKSIEWAPKGLVGMQTISRQGPIL